MCDKCKDDPTRRNTRYCDDWWDDSSHGGYKADRARKQRDYERDKLAAAEARSGHKFFMEWE